MRKFTFFLAMMVAMVTTSMAQTLEFTFNKVSASEATVTVTGNEVEVGGITATIASNQPWKALAANSQTFPNASIVCPDKNTNTMTAGNEGTITLTLNNVPEGYSFKNVTFTSVALNGGGEFQGDDVNAQHVNFTLTKGETTLGVAENVKIKVNSNGGESVVLPFEVAEAYTAENGTLELKLTLSITEPKGCFYGLIKVAIDTEVAAVEPEPEPELPALEITGYTPTEAVESLETITITFNDEIEGTFDVMNMTQIYLGAKSNGCSYTVEGNVLTITPFNAITTPGEYALVIPEGLITRKANGEAIALNGEITFTVVEPTPEPEPEPAVVPAADKCYTVVAEGHSKGNSPQWAINDEGTKFVSTGDNTISTDEQKHFAFVAYEGQHYLYSVSAKKFVMKDASLAVETPDAIEITKLDNGKFFFRFDASHNINIGGSEQMIIDTWSLVDGGNQYTLNEAADFDAAEALAMLEPKTEPEPELPALEITGYTPTEAVESLETITITFNDEIEGTFDVMNMTQIYLGAKSNGCSYAVEGNVLTITPFNAITTPGEYALVIPEGLITRKANGEAIALNGEITFTVAEAVVEPELPEDGALVLDLTAEQIGTTYPYQLPDEEAAKIFALSDITVAVKINTGNIGGRKALLAVADPTKEANTSAIKYQDPFYVAYGFSDNGVGYLASWATGDRFTNNDTPIKANTQDVVLSYVINPTANTCKLFVNGNKVREWVNAHRYGFMDGYRIETPKSVKSYYENANIYIGGAMNASGAGEVFDGQITGVKVFNGALTDDEVAAISFEAPLPALEITGYTPTEAVESLDMITITFNDEIEGTFDMMAMNQVYLGAKSNGCAFDASGNTLNIIPFNAITTPGEYPLYIPEGLITRKANGEAISLNGEITFTVAEAAPAVDYTPTYTGKMNHGQRKITSISLGEGNVYETTADEQKLQYNDVTEKVKFVVLPGAEITPVVVNAGEWIHSYVYIDADANGFTAGIEEGSDWKPTGDLVSYSFYNNDGNSDGSGWNSYGDVISGNNRNKPALPPFVAPTEPGVYRMRIKADWCNIDPMGDSDGKFGDFTPNGGQIFDVMLEVVETLPDPALEITGYTPAAAVESLKDITVTFSEEIEGTFDVMNMTQIYVGSKSNGAEFTVNGNVLNISLFNAITTDGKYALYIPEGLITRKSNGEAISLNGDIEFEVKSVERFTLEAAIFPAPQGELTEVKGIRVEANQGPSLAALPTGWTVTNEAGDEISFSLNWLYDWETVLLMFNEPITEVGKYTLTMPASSLKTDDGKECAAATFEFEVVVPTTIEGVEAEVENVIYDLTGRRVENATKAGIYIVNGKKVLVK